MGVETNCFTHLPDTLLSCESGSSCSSGTLQVKYKVRPQDLFEDTTQPCIHVQRMGLVGDAGKLEFEEFWEVVEDRVDYHGYGEPPGLVPPSGGLSRLAPGIHNRIVGGIPH